MNDATQATSLDIQPPVQDAIISPLQAKLSKVREALIRAADDLETFGDHQQQGMEVLRRIRQIAMTTECLLMEGSARERRDSYRLDWFRDVAEILVGRTGEINLIHNHAYRERALLHTYKNAVTQFCGQHKGLHGVDGHSVVVHLVECKSVIQKQPRVRLTAPCGMFDRVDDRTAVRTNNTLSWLVDRVHLFALCSPRTNLPVVVTALTAANDVTVPPSSIQVAHIVEDLVARGTQIRTQNAARSKTSGATGTAPVRDAHSISIDAIRAACGHIIMLDTDEIHRLGWSFETELIDWARKSPLDEVRTQAKMLKPIEQAHTDAKTNRSKP